MYWFYQSFGIQARFGFFRLYLVIYVYSKFNICKLSIVLWKTVFATQKKPSSIKTFVYLNCLCYIIRQNVHMVVPWSKHVFHEFFMRFINYHWLLRIAVRKEFTLFSIVDCISNKLSKKVSWTTGELNGKRS